MPVNRVDKPNFRKSYRTASGGKYKPICKRTVRSRSFKKATAGYSNFQCTSQDLARPPRQLAPDCQRNEEVIRQSHFTFNLLQDWSMITTYDNDKAKLFLTGCWNLISTCSELQASHQFLMPVLIGKLSHTRPFKLWPC